LRANPRAIEMTVRPYSFVRATQTVWEPPPPFDAVPYHLFAAGMRALRVKTGITLDELRELLTVVLLEPARDLPPEDDLVTALWEKAIGHVEYDVVDAFAEGDAAAREAFFAESDEVEQRASAAARARANRLEAKAMAVATDKSALGAGDRSKASPMSLDGVVL